MHNVSAQTLMGFEVVHSSCWQPCGTKRISQVHYRHWFCQPQLHGVAPALAFGWPSAGWAQHLQANIIGKMPADNAGAALPVALHCGRAVTCESGQVPSCLGYLTHLSNGLAFGFVGCLNLLQQLCTQQAQVAAAGTAGAAASTALYCTVLYSTALITQALHHT